MANLLTPSRRYSRSRRALSLTWTVSNATGGAIGDPSSSQGVEERGDGGREGMLD